MLVEEQIIDSLTSAFAPVELRVINESAQHAGHAGHDGSNESHFRVIIRAPAFAEMSRIARHRAIHAALGAELVGCIHALALEVSG
ncbi:MAG: BolA family transcriptional regulator [Rhodobacterales bacterium]|nr:MAG: BolA family transcriptional regulator [Rhodobacterales bacterium]